MIWIILILVIFLLIAYFIGNYFYQMIINAQSDKSSFIEQSVDNHVSEDGIWFYEKCKVEETFIKSFDNLSLHAYEIKQSDQWVIVVHGYYGNAKDMKYAAKKFYERGFSVLMIDLRGHGKSEGSYVGFGGHDSDDVNAWIQYVLQTKANRIYLYGVSMGGATVMMCSDQVPKEVKGIIEDCGYSTLKEMFQYQLKQMFHLPSFPILIFANAVLHLKAHYQIKDIQPIEHVRNAKVPMLFIHGDNDTFVPYKMLDEIYNACTTSKMKVVIKHGKHANNHSVDSKTYWEAIDQFIQQAN